MNETLIERLQDVDDIELDILWTLLKRQDLGIARKLVCMGWILDIDEEVILREARKKDGRVLDKANRMDVHDVLIGYERD